MKHSLFAGFLLVFGLIGVLVGSGVLVSEASVMRFCAKGCWLNSLLEILFGEKYAKAALAAIWFLATGIVFWMAFRMHSRKQGQRNLR